MTVHCLFDVRAMANNKRDQPDESIAQHSAALLSLDTNSLINQQLEALFQNQKTHL